MENVDKILIPIRQEYEELGSLLRVKILGFWNDPVQRSYDMYNNQIQVLGQELTSVVKGTVAIAKDISQEESLIKRADGIISAVEKI